jgi:hypothetical protein
MKLRYRVDDMVEYAAGNWLVYSHSSMMQRDGQEHDFWVNSVFLQNNVNWNYFCRQHLHL